MRLSSSVSFIARHKTSFPQTLDKSRTLMKGVGNIVRVTLILNDETIYTFMYSSMQTVMGIMPLKHFMGMRLTMSNTA